MTGSSPESRRRFLTRAGAVAAAASLAPWRGLASAPNAGSITDPASDLRIPAEAGRFSLPPLPYAPEALAPAFAANALHQHHGDHHAGHVDALNATLAEAGLRPTSLRGLLRSLGPAPATATAIQLRYHGGAHAAHTLYWTSMRPNGGGDPPAAVAAELERDFGSVAAFRDHLRRAALGVFGSGWAWLLRTGSNRLAITTTPEEDHPWMTALAPQPGEPILALDVWEHAYYLQHQNRRADHVDAFINAIDWNHVARTLRATA